MKQQQTRRTHQQYRPEAPRFTIAAAMAHHGQRLRADESATRMTFALAYRSRHAADVSRKES